MGYMPLFDLQLRKLYIRIHTCQMCVCEYVYIYMHTFTRCV